MNSLYKRFVTMCMISISAFLAWIYCIFEYRDKVLYIAVVSLVLIVSVYALFAAAYKIKVAKDAQLEQYITTTITNLLSHSGITENDELTRLSKALYVQLRKSNTLLTQMTEEHKAAIADTRDVISDSIDNAVKLSIKYNQLNNNKLLETGTELSNELTDTCKDLLDTLNRLNTGLIVERNSASATVPFDNEDIPGSANSLDIFDDTENADVIPFPVNDSQPEEAADDDPNRPMSPEEIAALFASAEADSPEPETDPEPEEPVQETDPNKPLSPEEIAALFASMQ